MGGPSRVPILLLAGKKRTPLKDKTSLSRGCQLVKYGTAARSRADNEGTLMIHE